MRVSRSAAEWHLLLAAVRTLASAVLATRMLPYRVWRQYGLKPGAASPRQTDVSPPMIVRAIDGASRIVPGGTNCLARALAGRALMTRHGLASELVLGVAKNGDGTLKSHAWLRHGDDAVLGEQGVRGFVAMPDLAGRL